MCVCLCVSMLHTQCVPWNNRGAHNVGTLNTNRGPITKEDNGTQLESVYKTNGSCCQKVKGTTTEGQQEVSGVRC